MVAARALESRAQFGIDPIKAGRDHHMHIGGSGYAHDRQDRRTKHEEPSNERSWFHKLLQSTIRVSIWREIPPSDPCGDYCLEIVPSFLTRVTRPRVLMSWSGLPSTAIMSANIPGLRSPIFSAMPRTFAGVLVAEVIACCAGIPSATRRSNSGAVWPAIPATA